MLLAISVSTREGFDVAKTITFSWLTKALGFSKFGTFISHNWEMISRATDLALSTLFDLLYIYIYILLAGIGCPKDV